jgi:hypothetical protein
MKRQTVNMFAATNEDLPIFSGFELTQVADFSTKDIDMTIYTVNYTTEYSDGETSDHTSKAFDTFEQAAIHAADISKAHLGADGFFRGTWQHNYQVTFIEDAPSELRITARIVAQ